MSTPESFPRAVEEHTSLLADWTVHPTGGGFLVREQVGDSVNEYGPLPDQAAAECFIEERRETMEESLEALMRMTKLSHH